MQKLHHSTSRDYLGRMNDEKVKCMKIARKFGKEFFDGDRRYGYGGYTYDGRFKAIAEELIRRYRLDEQSVVLDFGCAKGFLIKELQDACGCQCFGYDVSGYALSNSVVPIEKPSVHQSFDLIVSLATLHNLNLHQLKVMLQYFEKAAQHSYITVDSYRNVQELFNLQCWALTANQFFSPKEWEFLFDEWGYNGDYEFLYFT
jgi:SAM-dependent methyltransferase